MMFYVLPAVVTLCMFVYAWPWLTLRKGHWSLMPFRVLGRLVAVLAGSGVASLMALIAWTVLVAITGHAPQQQLPPLPASVTLPFRPTAICNDKTVSYSLHHQGTCSHHGGVKEWLDGN